TKITMKRRAGVAITVRSTTCRRLMGAADLRSNRPVLLAEAPVATSVHAREFILDFSSAEVVRHLARLHALEVGLHVGVERLAHLTAHLAYPSGHRARVVLVHITQTRLVKAIE